MLVIMFPLWITERFSYWMLIALMVLAIDQKVRGINLDMLNSNAICGKWITIIILVGVALLFLWVLSH